ncbi:MAG: tetratricopeptide repeat protein, partial [Pseudomonadota bacterium]
MAMAQVSAQVTAQVSNRCATPAPAVVIAVDGAVTVRPDGGGERAVRLGDALCAGDRVLTGPDGRVELRLTASETTLGLDAYSEAVLPEAGAPGADGSGVGLSAGVLRFLSSVRSVFTVTTRHATAGIDGTEAVMAATDTLTLVAVREGDVALEAGGASVLLPAGRAGLANGRAPRLLEADAAAALAPRLAAIALNPAGSADWAIHYPRLIERGESTGQRRIAPGPIDDGRADEAEVLLAEARRGATGARAARLDAHAALVAIARGRAAAGGALAANALEAAPDDPAALVATGYAEQAAGRVEAAIEVTARAADLAPGDATVAARLAELHFVDGDAHRAGREARRSLALAPGSLAGAVLGLAALAEEDRTTARTAFEGAIAADSEDPLPRLGLGLLLVRQGAVTEGRRELETAAALSPRRAVFRTWLGRAYAAEGLSDKALAQYALARAADPDDPAPWLLEA